MPLFIGILIVVSILVFLLFALLAYIGTRDPSLADIECDVRSGLELGKQKPDRLWTVSFVLFDRVLMKIFQVLSGGKKYFKNGVDTIDFSQHLEQIKISLPKWTEGEIVQLQAHTSEGIMTPAFQVWHWAGTYAPTLVYHHGASEYPFYKSFHKIFPKQYAREIGANLVIIRSPFHEKNAFQIMDGGNSLSEYMALMAVSVRLTELIFQLPEFSLSPLKVVAGFSLGGFITNRHHVEYDTADVYIPFMAGTRHAEIFFEGYNAHPSALRRGDDLRRHLNFSEQWDGSDNSNVFPVLGRYDCLNYLETQGPSYGDMPVEVWDVGHLTGFCAYRLFREKITAHLQKNFEC